MEGYMSRSKASNALGIHWHTLYNLAKNNKIESVKIGDQTVYNVRKFLVDNGIKKNETNKKKYMLLPCI